MVLTPKVHLIIGDQFTVSQEASLVINSGNMSDLGYYSATLIATDIFNSLSSSALISIELYSNPCVGVLSTPVGSNLNTQIEINESLSSTEISIGSFSNGECNFEL